MLSHLKDWFIEPLEPGKKHRRIRKWVINFFGILAVLTYMALTTTIINYYNR